MVTVAANNLPCNKTRDRDKQIVKIQLVNLVFTSLKEEVQFKAELCVRKQAGLTLVKLKWLLPL